AGRRLCERIYNSMSLGSRLVLLGWAFPVAWRAGDHPPNVSIALAVVFITSHDAFLILLEELRVNAGIGAPVLGLTYILGAGFYSRASQLFPRTLTSDDITSTPTIWGKIKSLRVVLVFFLRARAVWVFVAVATLLTVFVNNRHFSEAIRLVIVLTGLVYFYVMYGLGDAVLRRMVLLFLDVAVATYVDSFVDCGVYDLLHLCVLPYK